MEKIIHSMVHIESWHFESVISESGQGMFFGYKYIQAMKELICVSFITVVDASWKA